MNKRLNLERPELHPIPVKSPMHHIGIDFVGPISPISSSGNWCILTVSDYFTRFGWAHKGGKECSFCTQGGNRLSNICVSIDKMCLPISSHAAILHYGYSPCHHFRSEFNNLMNVELMQSMEIDHRLTTAYHPQANGLDERFNQTLKNGIAKFSHDHRDEWDVNLGELAYAYNTSFQESTKHSPFEAMLGKVARLSVDCNTDNADADRKLETYTNLRSPDAEERDAKRRKIEVALKKNIEQAQQAKSTLRQEAWCRCFISSWGSCEVEGLQ